MLCSFTNKIQILDMMLCEAIFMPDILVENKDKTPKHLKKLPIKNNLAAPGDVVGGFVYM